jgi:hypothetical protein
MGAHQALYDAGLRVPTDVSVVSFDDDAIGSWVRPGLTTFAIPHYDLGRTAVDVLFDEIGRDRDEGDREARVHRVAIPANADGRVGRPSEQLIRLCRSMTAASGSAIRPGRLGLRGSSGVPSPRQSARNRPDHDRAPRRRTS